MPLAFFLVPIGPIHPVVQADVSPQVVLVHDAFKVVEDFFGSRVEFAPYVRLPTELVTDRWDITSTAAESGPKSKSAFVLMEPAIC